MVVYDTTPLITEQFGMTNSSSSIDDQTIPDGSTTLARGSLTTSSPNYKSTNHSVNGTGAPEGSGKVEDASSTPSAAMAMMTSCTISLEPSPADSNVEGSPSTLLVTANANAVPQWSALA